MELKYGERKSADLKDMIGVTMISVEQDSDGELIFVSESGYTWSLYHQQDCCENVGIEDITGNLSDLVGSPITMADEVEGTPPPFEGTYIPNSFTWTFYKFATLKGYVDIRWYGESNGYYSESVYFCKVVKEG